MTRLRIMGTRRDPVWSGARRAAELVMRSTRKGPRANRVHRVQVALEHVLPNAGRRFAQVVGPSPSHAQVQHAATVALANALLDRYMALGLKVWESRSDPRVINVLEKAGLSGLGDPELDEAAQVMLNVACDPSTVGVVSGIVGAFTYGIGGALVGAGGGLAQQTGCPQGAAPAPVPLPPPPPPAPSTALPSWIVPAAVGVGFAIFAGLIIYGASQ